MGSQLVNKTPIPWTKQGRAENRPVRIVPDTEAAGTTHFLLFTLSVCIYKYNNGHGMCAAGSRDLTRIICCFVRTEKSTQQETKNRDSTSIHLPSDTEIFCVSTSTHPEASGSITRRASLNCWRTRVRRGVFLEGGFQI